MGKVIVGCKAGENAPDDVTVAYLTARAALDQGHEVVMWLSSEGVRLATEGYTDGIRADAEPTGAAIHREFIDKGGRFYACPVCWKDRGLDEGTLVQGAEIKGATPLLEWSGTDAMVFSY